MSQITETYDIVFHDDRNSNNKGFALSLDDCRAYIRAWAGTNYSYFEDYKGGMVCIIANSISETIECYSVDTGKLVP